ncbi:hypothetical protein C8J56DRAFT_249418 [Mycena floridula]|nr:hypothetical protein C8J56DRAFT_249418 [Mycena floridula]
MVGLVHSRKPLQRKRPVVFVSRLSSGDVAAADESLSSRPCGPTALVDCQFHPDLVLNSAEEISERYHLLLHQIDDFLAEQKQQHELEAVNARIRSDTNLARVTRIHRKEIDFYRHRIARLEKQQQLEQQNSRDYLERLEVDRSNLLTELLHRDMQARMHRNYLERLEVDRSNLLTELLHRDMQARMHRLSISETERKAAEVAESRRRMLEMLAQEAEAKRLQNEAREREEIARRAREQAERQRIEEERRAAERRANEWARQTLREEKRCQKRDQDLLQDEGWSPKTALKRYKAVTAEFESTTFSTSQPLTAGSIPWPVVVDPRLFRVAELTWEKVERFFEVVQPELGSSEYEVLLKQAQRMFHPDRWKSRGLLQSVMDAEMQTLLEEAGKLVSQAVTPLYAKLRPRS